MAVLKPILEEELITASIVEVLAFEHNCVKEFFLNPFLFTFYVVFPAAGAFFSSFVSLDTSRANGFLAL